MSLPLHTYQLAGWRVSSDFEIPDLLPWPEDGLPPDIVVKQGTVPERIDDLLWQGPLLQVGRSGACCFAVSGVAAYHINAAANEVTVAPKLDPADPAIRVFLLGTVFGLLCHKRGLLPLHASCVAIQGAAVAFAGPSGVGKSTLAAAFVRAGFPVLADDVTAVDISSGSPIVFPVFPRLKLWREAIDQFEWNVEGLERSRQQMDKFHLPVEKSFNASPLPLKAVYLLHRVPDPSGERIRPLSGARAVRSATEAVYRPRIGERILGQGRIFQSVAALCGSTSVNIFSFTPGFEALDSRVADLLALHAAVPQS